MSKNFNLAWLACASALLSACGGGGMSADRDDPPPARATVLTALLAGSAPIAQIDAGTKETGLQALSGAAKCDVDIRYVVYMTRDPSGAAATATEGVLVPKGSDPACTGDRPVLLYAHGTSTTKSLNMADVVKNKEASLLMAMFAAQGFIVVMPNYLGYDKSSLSYHPYLNAESQAMDMVDGLRAAKTHLAAASAVKPSSKLFISGYSQGGHVAMATHKIIERDYASEFTVTASGPMSGPYNLVKMNDVIIGPGPVNGGATLFTPLLLTSYQKSYGNVYGSVTEAYQSPYAATAESLFPTDTPIADLMAAGKLPADPTFTKLFGAGGLITDTFRASYFPNSGFRVDSQKNTLLGWTPKRPLALCAGKNDPTVFFFNTTDMQADLASRGVLVPAFDLETRASMPAGAAFDLVYGGFQQAKAAAGAGALAQYHGGLVPPFCTALMRGYFQQVLASGQ
ncbi:prolyl oligopeptidase family serine peptidase [Paucibacter sp. APW11]|uniref:Prolyl oligopeptidase family serine peptidase n=1 Tax=Roseateles aquae TaxID=3077235 RepID=A0ABU3PAU8_9BURK|nr:prolyl oligopeptidase family serine peptidase [Paucibacter sp. APW11]MDT8999643.1 prolyl oligopeptidase family serine peptidase [Paucibacter sp. APW11]